MESNFPKYVITIIHGTFSRKSRWVNESSPFSEALKTILGNDIVFETPFRWSGDNNNKKRFEAGDALSKVLIKQKNSYPKSKKILIAHSHAGNIVLYALKKCQNISEDFNVITLATPFLYAHKQSLGEIFRFVPHFLFSICLLFFYVKILPLVAGGLFLLAFDKPITGLFNFIIIIMLSVSYLVFFLFNKITRNTFNQLIQEFGTDFEEFSFAKIKHGPFLALTAKFDEAGIWLKISYLCNNFFAFWHKILLHCSKNIVKYIVIVVVLDYTMIMIMFSNGALFYWMDLIDKINYVSIFIVVCVLIFSALCFIIDKVLKSNTFFFGSTHVLQFLFFSLSVNSKPPIKNYEYYCFDAPNMQKVALNHSLYLRADVMDYITTWILSLKS